MTTPFDAIVELEAVLDQYESQGGGDPDTIYAVFSTELDRFARINVSDLRTVLAAARLVHATNGDCAPLQDAHNAAQLAVIEAGAAVRKAEQALHQATIARETANVTHRTLTTMMIAAHK